MAITTIVAVWIFMVAVVGMGGDYPLNDDWAYAYSAKLFLHTGQLRILDWAAPSLVAHIVWGAALLRSFGESYVVLRAGTLFLAPLGLLFLYGLGRRAGLAPARAVLPPLALSVSPWFFNLAFTYMTDVPWLMLVLWALWLGAGALRPLAPPPPGRLLFVSVLLGVAALIRQFVLVMAPAFLVVVVIDARRRQRSGRALFAEVLWDSFWLLLPLLLIYGSFHHWYNHIHGQTLAHRDTWRLMHEMSPRKLTLHAFCVAFYAGLWLLPLGLAQRGVFRDGRNRRLALYTALALSGFAAVMAIPALRPPGTAFTPAAALRPAMPYLSNVFYAVGLGPPTLLETYLGRQEGIHPGFGFSIALTLLSLLGAVLASGLFWAAARGVWSTLRGQKPKDPQAALFAEVRTLCGVAGGLYLLWHLGTSAVLFDRYILPLLPICWLLCLAELPKPESGPPLRRLPLYGLLVLFAVVSAAGTHEYLSWNTARAQAVQDLLKDGISQDQIDAGFEWNGTWRFAEFVRRTNTLQSSWWTGDLPYRLSYWPASQCETFRRYPFWTWPGGGDPAIYVLRCPTTDRRLF